MSVDSNLYKAGKLYKGAKPVDFWVDYFKDKYPSYEVINAIHRLIASGRAKWELGSGIRFR